jgi:hypothetical protein
MSADQAIKQPCRVATISDVALSGLQTIDSIALVAGDRVLVRAQANPNDNGIYVAASGVWTRATDFDATGDAVGGTLASVTSGTEGEVSWWRVAGEGGLPIGTSPVDWQRVDGGVVLVTEFGADPSGTADSTSAINAAKAVAEAQRRELVFPAGDYLFSETLSLGWFEGIVRGVGRVTLICTDPDIEVCVLLDGSESATLSHRFENIDIYGAGGAEQIGLHALNGLCSVRRNITVRNVGGTAFRIDGDVLSEWDNCRVIQGGHPFGPAVPDFGFAIADSPRISATSACIFNNCMVEVAKVRGWYLFKCINSKWTGGTSEGLGGHVLEDQPSVVGMLIDVDSERNIFEEVFFESNTGGDVVVYGRFNTFKGCTMFSLSKTEPYNSVLSIEVKEGALGNTFQDGHAYAAAVDSGGIGTQFDRMDFDFSVTDSGTGTQINRTRQQALASAYYPSRQAGNVENPDLLAWDFYREANDGTCGLGGSTTDGSLTQNNTLHWTRNGNRIHFDAIVDVTGAVSWPTGIPLVRMDIPWVAAVESSLAIGFLKGFSLPSGCCQFAAIMPEGTNYVRLCGLRSDGGTPVWLDGASDLTDAVPTYVRLSGSFQAGSSD